MTFVFVSYYTAPRWGVTRMFTMISIVRPVLFLIAFALSPVCSAQPFISARQWVEQLNLNGGLPQDLLATRSVVFHSFDVTEKELNNCQEYFQRTGIDAVAYFPLDLLVAGPDISIATSELLTKREISHLVLLEKLDGQYRMSITVFNKKQTIADPAQPAWSQSNRLLLELLKQLNRQALSEQKKLNLLVNDFPEVGMSIDPIKGKRNEFFAVDMKVDLVAIPKFGDDSLDVQLAAIMEANFPFKYKLTDNGVAERDLRKQGFLYTMKIVRCRAGVARELLGYPTSKAESAVVSVTYPHADPQVKNFPSNTIVYKVYFKHIDSGNVFLGNKWDADLTWQQAILNNIKGMKQELRL